MDPGFAMSPEDFPWEKVDNSPGGNRIPPLSVRKMPLSNWLYVCKCTKQKNEGRMDHIPTTRLKELYHDGVVLNGNEANHLRQCDTCSTLLLKFAEQRAKSAELRGKKQRAERFKKSA